MSYSLIGLASTIGQPFDDARQRLASWHTLLDEMLCAGLDLVGQCKTHSLRLSCSYSFHNIPLGPVILEVRLTPNPISLHR